MIDNLLGGDDEDPDDSTADSDMGGGLFDGPEDGGDDLMGDGDDDLMGGGDDDLMGDDDMAFDGMDDGGGATSAEMDNRIDELENEVASLSSTVNTVKSENEQISESVGEVEENVRKLLEVYEMVTRGVNPFVDENEMGDALGGGGGAGESDGSMGLFGNDETEDSDIDESVADADADEFFDDDFDDGEDEGDGFADFDDSADNEGGSDFDDGMDDFEEGGSDFDDGMDDFEEGGSDFDDGMDDFDDDDGDDGEGKSFEELKAEYESGDADWDEGAEESTNDHDEDAMPDEGASFEVDAEGTEPMDDPGSGLENGDQESDGMAEAGTGAGNGSDRNAVASEAPVSGGKPYLETLPSGYVSDIVVMDWLEFLVEEAGVDGAARTIAYYEAIEWVDEPAADTLQTFLNGFGAEVEADPEPRSSLTVSHHNTSLRFISRILNPDMEMVSFGDDRARSGRAMDAGGGRPQDGRPRAANRKEGLTGRSMPERRSVEPDGGRELSAFSRERQSGASDGFNWGDDRRE